MEGEALKEGKARVRRVLIDPLIGRGMSRGRMTLAEEAEFLSRLEARLAYMAEDKLAALAETVAAYAGGKAKDRWPAEVSICNWARALQVPPAGASRLVRSMLQSAAGETAEAGGYLAELMLYLKKFGAPPNDFGYAQIRQRADDNRSRVVRIRREQANGGASPADLEWMRGYLGARQFAQDIRAAKGVEQ